MAFYISITIALFSCHQELFKNSLRTQLAMAKRGNQPTYYFHYCLDLTEMSPKNNSQIIGRCNMNIPMKDVKCQYLNKRRYWQRNVLGNISNMHIGNRHQRHWWMCFSVWATWQCLMGLVRLAAGAGMGCGCPARCQYPRDLLHVLG